MRIRHLLAFSALAFSFVALSSAAYAECNNICVEKCQRTAFYGHMTVRQCIAKWSQINAMYGGTTALQFQRKVGKNTDIYALRKLVRK